MLFTLIVAGILFSMPLQAYAKKSKTAKKALKAYKEMLSQEKIYIVPADTLFEDLTYRYDRDDPRFDARSEEHTSEHQSRI